VGTQDQWRAGTKFVGTPVSNNHNVPSNLKCGNQEGGADGRGPPVSDGERKGERGAG